MGCHQADAAKQAAWRSTGERPAGPQRHLLGVAVGCALARRARTFGPYTTCYNRFVRWRRAGVWGKIMNALAGAHDAAVQMIDTSVVRVHRHPRQDQRFGAVCHRRAAPVAVRRGPAVAAMDRRICHAQLAS